MSSAARTACSGGLQLVSRGVANPVNDRFDFGDEVLNPICLRRVADRVTTGTIGVLASSDCQKLLTFI